MKIKKALLLMSIAAALVGCHQGPQTGSLSNEEIGKIAADYLVQHPDFLIKASDTLKKQQLKSYVSNIATKAYQNLKTLINDDKVTPYIGNDNPKVTIVEFFDYQCMYCAKMAPDIKKLISDNNDIKLVLKETPIFGSRWKASAYAAKMGLNVYQQTGTKGYEMYHDAVFASGKIESKLTDADVNKFAKKAGADITKWAPEQKDDTLIKSNLQLFQSLGFAGTPALLVIPANIKSAADISVIAGADTQSLQEAVKKALAKAAS